MIAFKSVAKLSIVTTLVMTSSTEVLAFSNTNTGANAGASITTGSANTNTGENAGQSITTGGGNTFTGWESGKSTVGGSSNSFYGADAGSKNISGLANTIVGASAGRNNTASHNTFIGFFSGGNNTTGRENTFIGGSSGIQNQSASRNTHIGYSAGSTISTGNDNTIIGHDAVSDIPTRNLSLQGTVVIGSASNAQQNNSVVIGFNASSSSADSLAIGASASTTHDGSITIGHGSSSHAANTVLLGTDSTVSWDPSADSSTTLGTSNYRFEDIFSNKISVNAASGDSALIDLYADAGSSNNDRWSIEAADAGSFTIASYASGSKENLFTVNNNGNATLTGNLTVNSDRRLKQDIKNIDNATQLLSKIEGVTYHWKPELKRDEKKQYGLIAQNVEAAIPELIQNGDKGIKSVNYQALIPVLVNAVNSQQKQIEKQQKQIEKLVKLLQAK